MAEGRENPRRSFLSKMKRGDGKPGGFRIWLGENWAALFMLFFIFLLALFVRAYFAYDISQNNGYAVSGGSDSYYWKRIIDYSADSGKQLFWDPLTAYPDGIRNPRPPMYSMSVVVPAVIAQDLFSSLNDAVGFMFIWSTAFWGALTVVPTYFLGKETFGKRAGLVAAFFLAVMPSHVQRSVLSNADHDAIILFFIVLTFYFLLKAVKNVQQKHWVESWRSPKSIKDGLLAYFRESKTAILFALMAGTAFGTVIMIWVGFAYVAVLILAYFVIQVLFNRFRNIDSMGVMLVIFIAMGFGYLLSYPVYLEQELIAVRFDVPVYLFFAAMLFGGMFVVTRDLPWTIVIPTVTVLAVVGVAVISIVNPALGQAILSGEGYFIKSKLYSTIAEAKAPIFSELALSFGMVTFFMSLIGLLWAIVKMPKRANAEYIFIVVWLGAAIFMAISAGRFMFNAAPAFAISSAWVLVIIVDRLDFNNARKSLVGGSGSPWQIIKKSIKLRHVVGALFLAFMVVLPNVWYSVDAGIPTETKQSYDLEIYKSFPKFMRPGGYDVNGTDWYLGAFGFQLPLPSYYFPAAWSWFAEQDKDTVAVDRPAFVAWWDYGFEAIQEGDHPTVADNFQNGYQITGNALMAQSELDTVAIFAFRLLQSAYHEEALKAEMHSLFEKYNVSVSAMDNILTGPGQPIIDEVLSDPIIYGPMATDLSDANARVTAGRVELSKLGLETLVSLYGEICEKTGWSIQYFMVDSRMFPLSGTSTGIFYAPAKLSDRRLTQGSTPSDFYTVKAVLSTGAEVDLDQLKTTDVVTDYRLDYKDMFYDSMFYRAMVGYSGADVGGSNSDGIPGWSGNLYTSSPMPGWNMTHFKMVYRTAYYNPFPTDQIAEHQSAWTAMNLQDALDIKKEIDAGKAQGYVDQSAGSYYRAGAVFLKYYPGAIVNGTLTTQEGFPAPGVNVTVSDEFGIPHQLVKTDANGSYSVIVPQGNVTIEFSKGSTSNIRLIGDSLITSITFNVTDDQAMRAPYDLDGDGILDFYITKNVVMAGSDVSGDIFWDLNNDGNYTSGDALIPGATVYATDLNNGRLYSFDAPQGSIDFKLPPGEYYFSADLFGRNLTTSAQINVTQGKTTSTNLALIPSSYNGTLYDQAGAPAAGVDIVLTDLPYGFERTTTTASDGKFSFPRLLEGKYSLTTTAPGMTIFATEVALSQGQQGVLDATISEAVPLKYRVAFGGTTLPYAVYSVRNYYDPTIGVTGIVDNFGAIDLTLPRGLWTIYVSYFEGSSSLAGSAIVSTEYADSVSGVIEMATATAVNGVLRDPTNSPVVDTWMCFQDDSGARIWVMSDIYGGYSISLLPGSYSITSQSISKTGLYGAEHQVSGERTNIQLKMSSGVVIGGTLWALKDANRNVPGSSDLAAYGKLKYVDDSGNLFTSIATVNGTFQMVFPSRAHTTISLGNPGYSEWAQNATFDASTSGIGLVATPDSRLVTGFVTYQGTGLRNIVVSFLPNVPLAGTVQTTTGAGGFYSVLVPPSDYSVVIDQTTGSAGGEKYQITSVNKILPSGESASIDLQPVKRVEMFGTVTGGGLNAQLSIEGPEQRTLNITSGNYSIYLLPGTYTVYSTSSLGSVQYANITSVDLSISSRQHDLKLQRAHLLSGVIRIGGTAVIKTVSISANSISGPVVHSKSTTSGTYSLALTGGDYTVSFVLEDLLTENGRRLYVEYYNDSAISMGSTDTTLNPVLGVRMDNSTFTGQVTTADGQPLQAVVEMTATGAFGMSVTFSTDASGAFSEEVQPGDYTVQVTRLQDNRIALLQVTIARNVPFEQNVTLSDGRFVTGRVTASGDGVELVMSVTSGNTRLIVSTDASGSFEMLVPPGNYTMVASTSKLEKGLTITYSGSQKVTVGSDNLVVDFALTRNTKYGLTATWNSSQQQTATPGVPLTYQVIITNTGNIADKYVFTLGSLTTNQVVDVSFPGSAQTYDFGTNNQVSVPVIITARTTTAAGLSKVPIQIKSQSSSATRADLSLTINVATVRSVLIYEVGPTAAVNSFVTQTQFSLNNTGNAQDNFVLNITNLDTLYSLGWTAQLVDPTNGVEVPSVGMPAFFTTPINVKFTAIRTNPDPTAVAVVIASSTIDPGVNTYASIPVNLPDLSLTGGDLTAQRSDISLTLDTSTVVVDVALVVALVALVVSIFYMRRKKGLGGKNKAAGGAKK